MYRFPRLSVHSCPTCRTRVARDSRACFNCGSERRTIDVEEANDPVLDTTDWGFE